MWDPMDTKLLSRDQWALTAVWLGRCWDVPVYERIGPSSPDHRAVAQGQSGAESQGQPGSPWSTAGPRWPLVIFRPGVLTGAEDIMTAVARGPGDTLASHFLGKWQENPLCSLLHPWV